MVNTSAFGMLHIFFEFLVLALFVYAFKVAV